MPSSTCLLLACYGHALHPLLLHGLCCCLSSAARCSRWRLLAAAPGMHILLLPKLRAYALELPPSSLSCRWPLLSLAFARCCTWRAYFASAQAASLCAGAAALITAWASSLSNPVPTSRAPLLQAQSTVEDHCWELPEAAAASLMTARSGPHPAPPLHPRAPLLHPRCSPTPAAALATFGPSPHHRFFSTHAHHRGAPSIVSIRPSFRPKSLPCAAV
jgi:hypothetical protein